MDGSIAVPTRAAIVAETRTWIGTPYMHQASVKGAGCDCLGLLRGVWRAFYGPEPETPPPYTPDWAELQGRETLLEAARRWLFEIEIGDAAPGDVVLFRMGPDAPMKHVAIVSAPDQIIHAYWGRAVVESRMTPFWRGKLCAAFSFPGGSAWRNSR